MAWRSSWGSSHPSAERVYYFVLFRVKLHSFKAKFQRQLSHNSVHLCRPLDERAPEASPLSLTLPCASGRNQVLREQQIGFPQHHVSLHLGARVHFTEKYCRVPPVVRHRQQEPPPPARRLSRCAVLHNAEDAQQRCVGSLQQNHA